MSAPFTKRLPEEGTQVSRDAQGRLWAYDVTVSCLGEVEQVRVQGRTVYRLPTGEVFSSAQQAAEHLSHQAFGPHPDCEACQCSP